MKIREKRLFFTIIVCLPILSEYCPGFEMLDQLHIKHYLVIVSIIYFLITGSKKFRMTDELRSLIHIIVGLYGISLVMQLINGSFKVYTLIQLYYIIIPFLIVYYMLRYIYMYDIDYIMTVAMLVSFISFISKAIKMNTLSWGNFLQMLNPISLFVDSTSAIGESGLSSYFVFMFIYFYFRGFKFRTILCAFGVFIGYKRFAVLYMLIMIVALKFVSRDKKVDNRIIWMAIGTFLVMPFVIEMMCSDEFARWFLERFGISLNKFTKTRIFIINTVIDANLTKYGLGTVTNFLEMRNWTRQTSMHNDILMVYMDCTIVGSFILTKNFFYMCKKNYYSFLTMLFVFCQMFVSHVLGAGTLAVWMLIYITIFAYNGAFTIPKLMSDTLQETNVNVT